MIEAAPAPLAGVLGRELGDWFARLHRARGRRGPDRQHHRRASRQRRVQELRLLDRQDAARRSRRRRDRRHPDCDWLAGSGLEFEGGVRVDPHGRTGIDDVLAVGDAAATFDPRAGRHVPGSHWEAAGRQATRAARVMLGLDPGAAPLSSFWTDQYGIRIQYLGHARGLTRRDRRRSRRAGASPQPSPGPDEQSPRCSSTGLAHSQRLVS